MRKLIIDAHVYDDGIDRATVGSGEVTDSSELMESYGLGPTDEIGGPSTSFLDYGSPTVVADSDYTAIHNLKRSLRPKPWAARFIEHVLPFIEIR
ncbi:MAG TPA: hypothetical protein VK712_04395 [Verrucomicrobiae bacterium]|jgi:hypothetical protein|nr:hypothetical protein [Verrucomicrobiae bacterium]